MTINKFNIRVYSLIINENNEVLLSDEFVNGIEMTKFPGGGLEFGEGPVDCLKREAIEEFGQEISIIRHFYTTDYFQEAFFFENTQLISIYYLAEFTSPINFKISSYAFDFPEGQNGGISFRWKSIQELSEKELTFPIDKKVLMLLKEANF